MTPARYEVLYVLSTFKGPGAMAQRAVQRALGVVRSTLSETLKKLDELGFVQRSKRTRAGRTVKLTPVGERALDECLCDALEDVTFAIDRALTDGYVYSLERACRAMRAQFDDHAPRLLYEWIDWDD